MVGMHTLQFWTEITETEIITHSAMRLLYSNLFSRSFTLSSSSAVSWQKCSQVKSSVRAGFLEGGDRSWFIVVQQKIPGSYGESYGVFLCLCYCRTLHQ